MPKVSNTNVTVGNTNTAVVIANDKRLTLILTNDSTQDIYLGVGANAVMNKGIVLKANGGSMSFNERTVPKDAINAISASGSANLCVFEDSWA